MNIKTHDSVNGQMDKYQLSTSISKPAQTMRAGNETIEYIIIR